MKGKYLFSRDVIFNKDLSGRLGLPHSLSDTPLPSPSSSGDRPSQDHACTLAGQEFDEVLCLKEFRRAEREQQKLMALSDAVDGGDYGALVAIGVLLDGDRLLEVGGDDPQSGGDVFADMIEDGSLIEDVSLSKLEPDILASFAMHASASTFTHSSSFDLSKVPSSFAEAHACSNASVWRTAMDREKLSLDEMGAFEEADLPLGERAIGLKWVYAFKTDVDGHNIPGKEKAQVILQGFNQHPGQYNETYTPVAKMASVRILLAWAAVQDLDIFQFNCKTAFLHAKIRHPLYVHQIPGYPLSNP